MEPRGAQGRRPPARGAARCVADQDRRGRGAALGRASRDRDQAARRAHPGRRRGGARLSADDLARHVSYFHELDAWTEYWDVYHPESRGRFYFGDDRGEPGLLTLLLPRASRPPLFRAWTQAALYRSGPQRIHDELARPEVAAAVSEVDELVAAIFGRHFGDPRQAEVQADYLTAIHRFAIDDLPPAPDRAARIAPDDPRSATAGRHTLEGDLMWFAWGMTLELAELVRGDIGRDRRALQMAGVAAGCPANFAWRGHRRTRAEYVRGADTAALLHRRGLAWAGDLAAATREVHALYRIREWGED
ncbi:MAG TPA: hypothetical protein VHT91_08025 [Kofleriaceae bacterium]|nr:hypothetical protein [Kofleriaceae bacterium]